MITEPLGVIPVIKARGIAWIGDVHLTSNRPGRRIDEDFASTVLRKVQFCLDYAATNGLVPVFLGDIFDRPIEENEAIKGRLMGLLLRHPLPCYANVGNHEIAGAEMAENDTLSLLATSGALRLSPKGGPAAIIECGDLKIGLGFTPYGKAIPDSVEGLFDGEVNTVFWVTHHDLAFAGEYPGALPLKEIAGCSMVVNGHMHLAHPPAQLGQTAWFNPGSLTRMKVNEAAHQPMLWHLSVETNYDLVSVPVPIRHEAFDLTGRLIEPQAEIVAHEQSATSEFAQALSSDGFDPVRTSDGEILREAIMARFDRDQTPRAVRAAIMRYFEAAGDNLPRP